MSTRFRGSGAAFRVSAPRIGPVLVLAPSEREKTAIYASDENGNPYSPAWFTLNLKLGIRVIDNLLINVSVENILDKRYRTYSSAITAPGRNFITSVKYNL